MGCRIEGEGQYEATKIEQCGDQGRSNGDTSQGRDWEQLQGEAYGVQPAEKGEFEQQLLGSETKRKT